MTSKKILIVAGEPSGDLHASHLVRNMKALDPGLKFFGLGGVLSKEAGVLVQFDISGLAIIGLVDAVKNIFTVGKVFKGLLNEVDDEKPDLAILIDYPGFNLRLAKELKKRSIPVAYYVSPQIWAWGANRIEIIKKCVRKILVFFKFEEYLYKSRDVPAEFVGHPLVETAKATRSKDETLKKYGLSGSKTTIALLPGSRRSEITLLLPAVAGACDIIEKRMPGVQFLLAKYPGLSIDLYKKYMRGVKAEIKIAEGDTYNVLEASDIAVIASGTATLEGAITGTPMVIVYKVGLVTYAAYKLVSMVKHIGIVNVIAEKEIAPEIMQFDLTKNNVADKVMEILSDTAKLSKMREELGHVKGSLGAPGASERAAVSILKMLK